MQLKEKDTKTESRMQNNEAINKGIENERFRVAIAYIETHTHAHKESVDDGS